MQEKDDRSILRPCFPIKDGESIDFYCAIKHLLFHCFVSFLGIRAHCGGEQEREGRQRPKDRFRRMHISSDLLCDFEDDIEFYRHPERKAGNADYHPNRCFLDAKNISKQVRDSVRNPGLVEEITRGCYEHSELDDTSHSIE